MVVHWRVLIEVTWAGSAMRLFQAWQVAVTIASYPSKTRLDSLVCRRNCQTFSTGLSSGDLGGSGSKERFSGKRSFSVVCQPDLGRDGAARRDVPEPEPSQQFADGALVIGDIPAGQDQLPQIDTAPAHHMIARELGAGFDR